MVYAGIGLFEATSASEGRGTEAPFLTVGHPALDPERMVAGLNAAGLAGMSFEAVRFTPRAMPGVASAPRFEGREIPGIRMRVVDHTAVRPAEVGIHVLAAIDTDVRQHTGKGIVPKAAEFGRLAGTARLKAMLDRGAAPAEIIGAWRSEVEAFRARRAKYLLY